MSKNKNYRAGSGYEYRRLDRLKEDPCFVKGERFYASRGICDIWYVRKEGEKLTYYEEQCKYSKTKATISTEEFIRLLNYAMDNEGKIKVALTSKVSRQPEQVWWLN